MDDWNDRQTNIFVRRRRRNPNIFLLPSVATSSSALWTFSFINETFDYRFHHHSRLFDKLRIGHENLEFAHASRSSAHSTSVSERPVDDESRRFSSSKWNLDLRTKRKTMRSNKTRSQPETNKFSREARFSNVEFKRSGRSAIYFDRWKKSNRHSRRQSGEFRSFGHFRKRSKAILDRRSCSVS